MPLNDEAVKEFIAAYEATDKLRIRRAFNAGVKLCVAIMAAHNKQWREENEGALPDDVTVFPTAKVQDKMEALLNTYSDAPAEYGPAETNNDVK